MLDRGGGGAYLTGIFDIHTGDLRHSERSQAAQT